jgi:hypothetical protein
MYIIVVKLSLCLINYHYAMKTHVSGGTAPPFLTSALDEGEWSAPRSCRVILGERPVVDLRIRGLVGPSAVLKTLLGIEP